MSLLKTLKLTDASRSGMIASPEARLRHKLLAKLDEQIAIAKADHAGEPFAKRGKRLTPFRLSILETVASEIRMPWWRAIYQTIRRGPRWYLLRR